MISMHHENSTLGARSWKNGPVALCVLLGALLLACGTHKELETDDKQPSKAGAAAPSSAQPERAATAGAASSSGPVTCWSTQCPPPASVVTMVLGGSPLSVACCLDRAAGTCGTAASTSAPCEPAPTADDRCPGVDLSALNSFVDLSSTPIGNTKVGCCTAKGDCGSDATAFGRGCVENAEASALMASVPVVGLLITIPPARRCDQAGGATGK